MGTSPNWDGTSFAPRNNTDSISVVSTSYDGKTRRLYPYSCAICGKQSWAPRHVILTRRRFCSLKCRGLSHRTGVEKNCVTCGKTVHVIPKRIRRCKSGLFFCSKPCKDKAQALDGRKELWPSHYKDGRHVYRSRAFRKYGKKCVDCGYEKDVRMLDVDHEDSDRSNNSLENLRPRCVWCHALKTRGVEFHAHSSLNGKASR